MLAKFAPRAFSAPVRYNAGAPLRAAFRPAVVARRTVTTDAASSHADKEDVPDVCGSHPQPITAQVLHP